MSDKPREFWFSENDELTDCGHWPDDWCYVKKLEYDALKAELSREREITAMLVEALLSLSESHDPKHKTVVEFAATALQKYEAMKDTDPFG